MAFQVKLWSQDQAEEPMKTVCEGNGTATENVEGASAVEEPLPVAAEQERQRTQQVGCHIVGVYTYVVVFPMVIYQLPQQ